MNLMLKSLTILIAAALLGLVSLAGHDRNFGDGTLPDFLAEYDVDEDGVLSEEERQAMKDARAEARAERIAEIDTDGDGTISEEERAAAREALVARIQERRSERFNEADADDDGAISSEEFLAIEAVARLAERRPERAEAIFNRLAGEDGAISEEEFLANLRPHRGHHRHHPSPTPEDDASEGEAEQVAEVERQQLEPAEASR